MREKAVGASTLPLSARIQRHEISLLNQMMTVSKLIAHFGGIRSFIGVRAVRGQSSFRGAFMRHVPDHHRKVEPSFSLLVFV